jgi:hypothetical protein
MTGIIEWTHDAQCAARPELGLTLGVPRWADDHLHGVLFMTDKEYDFFAAVAGVRSRFDRPLPLIPLRGVPAHLSWPAGQYFQDYASACAGWLHFSEIEACIRHVGADRLNMGFEIEVALEFMQRLVARLTDPHVRLVFNIESA